RARGTPAEDARAALASSVGSFEPVPRQFHTPAFLRFLWPVEESSITPRSRRPTHRSVVTVSARKGRPTESLHAVANRSGSGDRTHEIGIPSCALIERPPDWTDSTRQKPALAET